MVAMLVTALFYLALPDEMSAGPPWLLLAVVGTLLVPTIVAHRTGRHQANELLGYLTTTVLTAGLLFAIGRLVRALPQAPQE